MNIVIFGATGATGRCLVEQALAFGHTVTPSRATRLPSLSTMPTSPLSQVTYPVQRTSRRRLRTRMRSSVPLAVLIDSGLSGQDILANLRSLPLPPGISWRP